jgi:glycosyltransferase involved in cell wall biosynthesis
LRSTKTDKILLITNIPTPYRIPLFNELNNQLKDEGLKQKVIFGSMGYDRRKWDIDMSDCQFEYEVLPSKTINLFDPEKTSFTYSGLYRVISREKPSIIITNAFSIATMKLWLRSYFKDIPYIIWSGAINRKDSPDFFLRRMQRKILIKRASGFIAYGTKAKEYLVSQGANPDKVEIGINTVDTQYFKSETEQYKDNPASGDGKKHLLYVGDLSSRKNVKRILKILKILSNIRSDIVLDIVGDGEDHVRLEKYVRDNNLTKFIVFHGFKQKSDIPKFMAKADCFLFQTDFDIWGLVLVEAMASGVPCISSIHAGATIDLIKDGETGFAMDFSETEKVADKIQWIFNNPEIAKEIAKNSILFVSEHASIRKSSEGFVKTINNILEIKSCS